MTTLNFVSSNRNSANVRIDEGVIDVQFNPAEHATFNHMLMDLFRTLQALGYPRPGDVGVFVNGITRDNARWDKRGKWIGQFSRTFTAVAPEKPDRAGPS